MAVAALLAAAALAVPQAAAARAMPGCGTADSPGGEWPTYGHDLSNTRFQDKEKLISVADAPLLRPAWTFSTAAAGGEGDITGTPIVSDGCVYVATSRGWVFAMNADTGKLVWKSKFPRGGSANGTVAIGDRRCGTNARRVRVRRKVRVRTKARHGHRAHRGRAHAARHRHRRKRARYRWTWVTVTKQDPVYCGTVYVAASRTRAADSCPPGQKCVGPYVAALDQATGATAWSSDPIDQQPGADVYGSPVVFDGVVLLGVSGGAAELGDEADRYAFQGSMTFLDASTGRLLEKTWTIHPPGQPNDDYAGATIWSTPAVDPDAKVAYVGSSNPFRPQAEHAHANAILKFDADRRSPHFGQIVGFYKGLVDTYYPGASQMPCYDVPGNPPPYYPQGLGACSDEDLDFGAAPNLITEGGRKLVGEGQKSGVYHFADAQTMKPVRSQIVGPPSSVGGIVGSTAYDGQSVYGPVTAPGYMWSLSTSNAALRWVAPVGDGAHWGPPVAVANGVLYSVDFTGFLDAFDTRSGALLAKRPLLLGGSGPASPSWGGVSVARNTIYASVGTGSLSEGFVVAFRPGDVQDAPTDVQQTLGNVLSGGGGGSPPPGGGGGGGSGGSAIVAGPGAVYSTYATPVATASKGGSLSFVNLDAPAHDV
ncbi:MAG: PQQ-binding-like beta-propeller repeat protein, partial [Thermoleophilaceae bacterium]